MPSRGLGRGLAGAGIAVALVLAISARAPGVASRPASFQVTGYASDWTPISTLAGQAPALSIVGIDGVGVSPTGTSVGPPSAGALELLGAAHAEGLRATLLVGNWGGPAGVSPTVAARLLTSAPNRSHVVFKLVQIVRTQGWDGITIDLESLSESDGPGLAAFAEALRAALPHRDVLAVDVAAPGTTAGDVAEGYRLAALAKVADVVLMAYDEHGPWSEPGPIGGIPWVKRVLNVARSEVPARRLVLGIATYGYSWHEARGSRSSSAVTDLQAQHLAALSKRRPRWDRAQGEWTDAVRNRTVLWWSDARSFALRVTLAKRLHLGGVAIWQLASADTLPAR